MGNKLNALVIVLGFVLAACTPSAADVQKILQQTQAALPTETQAPTATVVPLSDVDVEAIVLLPGDLPAEFVGGQVKNILPSKFSDAPEAAQVVQQVLLSDSYGFADVTILLYESPDDRAKAFDVFLREERRLAPLANVGDAANIESNGLGAKILFRRCHAVVYIEFSSSFFDADTSTTYARRLDERLQPLVCR